MIGRVDLRGAATGNFVENNFLWVTTGTNYINGDVENNGWLQTAVGNDPFEYTEFTGVEFGTWVNNGVISMFDGVEGDWTAITGAGNGVTFNAGPDSTLGIDTYLGAPGSCPTCCRSAASMTAASTAAWPPSSARPKCSSTTPTTASVPSIHRHPRRRPAEWQFRSRRLHHRPEQPRLRSRAMAA